MNSPEDEQLLLALGQPSVDGGRNIRSRTVPILTPSQTFFSGHLSLRNESHQEAFNDASAFAGTLQLSASRVSKIRKELHKKPLDGNDSLSTAKLEPETQATVTPLPQQRKSRQAVPSSFDFEFASAKARGATGIPEQDRGEIWRQLVGVVPELSENDGVVYEELVKEVLDEESDRKLELGLAQFAKENRTNFNSWHELKQLLKACSRFTLASGWKPFESNIAPLSFIGAMLLSYLKAKEAFYLLHTMCFRPCYAFPGILDGDTLYIFCCIHERLVSSFLPVLAAHFRKEMVCSSHYARKWFSSLFTQCLGPDFVAPLWDLFLSEGVKIIFRVGIVLLQLQQNVLLDLDFAKIVQRLHYLGDKLAVSPEALVAQALNVNVTTKRLERESKKVKVMEEC